MLRIDTKIYFFFLSKISKLSKLIINSRSEVYLRRLGGYMSVLLMYSLEGSIVFPVSLLMVQYFGAVFVGKWICCAQHMHRS